MFQFGGSVARSLMDGMELKTVRLESYRTQLGVVLQESFLFDGSMRDNVAFSRPEASEDAVMRARPIARFSNHDGSLGLILGCLNTKRWAPSPRVHNDESSVFEWVVRLSGDAQESL